MTITTIIVCVIIIIILLKIYDNAKNKKTYELLKQFPSYPAYPFIGNLYLLFGSKHELMTRFDRMIERYDRLLFWFSSLPMIAFTKHDDITTILSHTHDRDILGFADEWFGTAILNAKIEEWKKSRKMLIPAFTTEMLAKYTDVFNEKSSALVNSFKQVADTGEAIDVYHYLRISNMDIISENTIGASIQTMADKREKFDQAVLQAFENIVERIVSPWLHPSFMYWIYLRFSKKNNIIKNLNDLPEEVLKDKFDDYEKATHKIHDADSSKAILDLLLKGSLREPSFTKTRIKDELIHVTLAGAENTAQSVSFLMLMLAIHQDIQQKVYKEIIDLLGNSGDTLTSDDSFNRLKYVEQCIMETTRMYSAVVATMRRTHKECILKDNKIVPANTLVFLGFNWAHRDKDLYKNPFKWDPENFSESAVQSRPKSSLLSFGYGARSCIGTKYAMISMKTQITHIIRNYHLSTDIKELTRKDLLVGISITSKLGYPIKFTTR